jgi:hypothetical protein
LKWKFIKKLYGGISMKIKKCLYVLILILTMLFLGSGSKTFAGNSERNASIQHGFTAKFSGWMEETKPKKHFKAKRKIAGLWDCHPYLQYKSNLQSKREKAIRKNRKKLKG